MQSTLTSLFLILAALGSVGCDSFKSRRKPVHDQNEVDAQGVAKRALVHAMRAPNSLQFGQLTTNRTSQECWEVSGRVMTLVADKSSREQNFRVEVYKPNDAKGVQSFLVVKVILDRDTFFFDKNLSQQIHRVQEEESPMRVVR